VRIAETGIKYESAIVRNNPPPARNVGVRVVEKRLGEGSDDMDYRGICWFLRPQGFSIRVKNKLRKDPPVFGLARGMYVS
jgi:hypothetical protein